MKRRKPGKKGFQGAMISLWRMEQSIKQRPEIGIPKKSKRPKGGFNEGNSKADL